MTIRASHRTTARPRRRRPPPAPVTLLDYLCRAPATLNPAFALSWDLQQQEHAGTLDLPALLTLQPALDQATAAGEREVQTGATLVQALTGNPAPPRPDQQVPEGF